MRDCNVASSCLLGSDALRAGSEEVVYENTSVDLDAYVLVGCSDPAGCLSVDVEVSVVTPAAWRGDTCAGSAAATPLVTGAYTMSGSFEDLTNTVDIGTACTGEPTSGREALFPVVLEPGERIIASLGEDDGGGYYYYYSPRDTNSLYLMEPCGAGAGSCLEGDAGEPAVVSYTNTTGVRQNLTLGAECTESPFYYYFFYYYYYYYYSTQECADLDMTVTIDAP
jgi:hypothetical protein